MNARSETFDLLDSFDAPQNKLRTETSQRVIPHFELVTVPAAFSQHFEQGVALSQRLIVFAQNARIRRRGLCEGQVQVTAAVIGRDVLIVTVALAIFIVTGFRGFKPSFWGKASTIVQISAVGIILFATVVPDFSGYYLPTIYVLVALFSVISGVHYIFHVAKLMNEDKKLNVEEKDIDSEM